MRAKSGSGIEREAVRNRAKITDPLRIVKTQGRLRTAGYDVEDDEGRRERREANDEAGKTAASENGF